MDPFRNAPQFDDTGFQRWKVLMQAHLQATGLNVWRVVSEGIKNNGHQEKQHDVTVKCIILSSLSDNMFNRVYSCENVKSYGRLSLRTMRARRMLPTKNIMFLLINLIALSNLMMRMSNQCTHI